MITPRDLYNIFGVLVPLYVAVALAYAAVRWWRLFTPEQCAGINRFVAMFAVPLLNFRFISGIDLSGVDLRFVAADALSKALVLAAALAARAGLEWCITLFSLATLPNTLLMGIPLLEAMYGGEEVAVLMVQVVVLQSIVWYTLLIFLYEYRAAREVIIMESSDHEACTPQGTCGNGMNVKDEANRKEGQKQVLVAIGLISRMVWSKLVRNPNFYASVGGLCWILVSASWDIKQPMMMEKSVTILSNCALGVAMFSLGNFMALQPRFVACGNKMAMCGLFMRFIAGPAIMALASLAVGIHGKTLKVSTIQAALPQAVVPFVFAREYNVHAEVLSTAVIFGMIVSLPVTILYYVFLELVIPSGGFGAMFGIKSASNLCNMPSNVRPLECYLWQTINHITNATMS